jgi:hypothetical protein
VVLHEHAYFLLAHAPIAIRLSASPVERCGYNKLLPLHDNLRWLLRWGWIILLGVFSLKDFAADMAWFDNFLLRKRSFRIAWR